MTQVYVVHGYTASPDKHWFPWLAEKLAQQGIACHRLAMPDPHNPDPEKWLDHLMVQVDLSQPTIFVGHSLGCVAILNYLATVQKAIIGAIFVSGFSQPLSTLPELDDFAKYYAKLPAYSLKSYVVSAIDDRIVPHHYSDHLAQHLNADYIRLNQGGHFLDREGITTFPLVLELINKLGDQATQ